MPMSNRERLKRSTSEILRFGGIADFMIIGIGKMIRRISVAMSETPMVMS